MVTMACSPTVVHAQYALPSTETAISIGNFALATEMGVRAADSSRQGRRGAVSQSRSPALAFDGGPSVFATALQAPGPTAASVQTRFTRSKAIQKGSEASILSALEKRQPEAVAEYRQIFASTDISRTFDKASQAFGFRSNDIADTMAAYWLVGWVVANDAKDFSPAAARAVRDQVKAGIARTSVAGFSPEKKHRLADEAIFNTLVLTAVFQNKEIGKVSGLDYRRVSDATQRAFVGFGADLRSLQLTDAGFVKR
ncbi:MAG: hypothetical protein DCF31_10575 [Alphaproteobacteria bacterium]|nr:MAG: hypothetical protein DCF31_10575 [Alphaproteobacteria bacterium]